MSRTFRCVKLAIDLDFGECADRFVDAATLPACAQQPCRGCADGARHRLALANGRLPSLADVRRLLRDAGFRGVEIAFTLSDREVVRGCS